MIFFMDFGIKSKMRGLPDRIAGLIYVMLEEIILLVVFLLLIASSIPLSSFMQITKLKN